MKKISILFLLSLVGCGHTPVKPELQVVERVEYIIKVPPANLMQLPAQTTPINADDPKLKQSDVAKWIKESEIRTTALENQLIGVAKFFVDEKQKLDDQAKKENK